MAIYRNYDNLNFITGLRGIAVLLVFLIHSGLTFNNLILNKFADWGKYGVMIFFVISGFTIYNQIISRNMNFKSFILIRFTRLILPYWPILLFIFIFPNYISEWSTVYPAENQNFNYLFHFMLINFFSLEYANTILGVEWTLSIEFIYYIIFGIFLGISSYKKYFKNTIIFFIIAYFLPKIIGKLFVIDALLMHWSPFPYGFMFALGGLAFIIRKKYEKKISKITLNRISNFVGLFVLFFMILNLHYMFIFNISNVFAFATFLLLICVRDFSLFGYIIRNPIFLFIGNISYSFYLLHIIILKLNLEINLGYKFLLIILVSFVWYYIFEYQLYRKIKTKLLRQ